MEAPSWLEFDVSRETLEKLEAYADLIRKWSTKINLVSRSTLTDIEDRHIWDSAQVYRPYEGAWTDLGSGGGLPGVVVAVLSHGAGGHEKITMIESDQRKATFLRTCARELEVPMTVVSKRIEDAERQGAGIVSARALASLGDLLPLATRHGTPDTKYIFLKGAKWRQEMEDAQKNWRFSCDVQTSKTNQDAAILTLKDVERA